MLNTQSDSLNQTGAFKLWLEHTDSTVLRSLRNPRENDKDDQWNLRARV